MAVQEEEDRLREAEEQQVREEAEKQRRLEEQAAKQAQRMKEIEERQAVRDCTTFSLPCRSCPSRTRDA